MSTEVPLSYKVKNLAHAKNQSPQAICSTGINPEDDRAALIKRVPEKVIDARVFRHRLLLATIGADTPEGTELVQGADSLSARLADLHSVPADIRDELAIPLTATEIGTPEERAPYLGAGLHPIVVDAVVFTDRLSASSLPNSHLVIAEAIEALVAPLVESHGAPPELGPQIGIPPAPGV